MIKSAHGLLKRCVEVASEVVPEQFEHYPFAAPLRLGWYPAKAFFRAEADEIFYRALPDMSGIVIPYFADFDRLSHLVVASYADNARLNPKRRSLISASGQRRRSAAGAFGIHRLKQTHKILVVTDDELLVARMPNVVAISGISPRLTQILKRSASVINLRSDNPKWLASMYPLAKQGFQVLVNDKPIVEHITDEVVKMAHEDLGLSLMTDRFSALIKNLVPLERAKALELVKQATNLDLSRALPDDFSIYRREADFYQAVDAKLDEVIDGVEFSSGRFVVYGKDGMTHVEEATAHGVQSMMAHLYGDMLDLLDWAYRDLKEVPSFYVYRGDQMETRADVSRKLADVVVTVLVRKARKRP